MKFGSGRIARHLVIPALLAAGASWIMGLAGPACARTFYVDYTRGSDQAAGTSEAQPWKHAPGDPAAAGLPAKMLLAGGDAVLFRGGVTYRGAIRMNASGEAGRPITFRGKGFGPGRAVFSGREPLNVRTHACQGDPSCARFPGAASLSVVNLPTPVAWSDQLILGGQRLQLAQWPAQSDPFWSDDISQYLPVERSAVVAAGAEGAWRVNHEAIGWVMGASPVAQAVLYLWGMPNQVTATAVDSYDRAGGFLVHPKTFRPYDKRPTYLAITNHPNLITRDFEYALIDNGSKMVVRGVPAEADLALELSRRSVAFDVSGQRNIVIEDFVVEGFSGPPSQATVGVALLSSRRGAAGIILRRNDIHDLTTGSGGGAVTILYGSGFTIEDNSFRSILNGSGLRIGAGPDNIAINRNVFDHIGRTGIAAFGVRDLSIVGNTFTNLYGAHGNTISTYLANQHVRISNNLISGVTRGITFHGDDKNTTANDIVINQNLVISDTDEGSSLQSWSKDQPVRGLYVLRNVFLSRGGRYAAKLSEHDLGVRFERNIIQGLALRGDPPGGWSVRDNQLIDLDRKVQPVKGAQAPDAAAVLRTLRVRGQSACDFLSADLASVSAPTTQVPGGLEAFTGVGPHRICAPAR